VFILTKLDTSDAIHISNNHIGINTTPKKNILQSSENKNKPEITPVWAASNSNYKQDYNEVLDKNLDVAESKIAIEEVFRKARELSHIEYNDTMNKQEDLSTDDEDESQLKMPKTPFKFLIIDCSPINFIDTTGVKTIKQVICEAILFKKKFLTIKRNFSSKRLFLILTKLV
jgi:hypothetical protein